MVRVAVIGLGYWGPNLVRALQASPDGRVAACCDVDPERLAALRDLGGVRLTTAPGDLLTDPGIDAVAVATPASSHYCIVRDALCAGKHVFVEKPLTTSGPEAADLVRLAEATGRILMVGHLFAYHPAVQQLIDVVLRGQLGEVKYVQSVRTSMGGWARRDTSIVWDALVHDVYILTALFGGPPRVVSAVGGTYLNPGIEDVVQASFTYPGGSLACCFASWYAVEKARRMMVVGSQRMLVYDDLASGKKLTVHECGYVAEGPPDRAGRRRMRWEAHGVSCLESGDDEPLRAELQHFLACIKSGEQPRTDARGGWETVAVLEAVDASIKGGGHPVAVNALGRGGEAVG